MSPRPSFAALAVIVSTVVTAAMGSQSSGTAVADNPPAADARLAGGATTVFDDSIEAFSFPAANLPMEKRASFFVGNSFFRQNWVAAVASTGGRDGLGPLFNTRSCAACHFKDGRGRPPEDGKPSVSLILRVSLSGRNEQGAPVGDPIYGDQIQGNALPTQTREADVFVDYQTIEGTYADGEKYQLRRPTYRLENTAYGPANPEWQLSPRVAPAIIGLGLLEAVDESTLASGNDPEDADGDGISGRFNRVWDFAAKKTVLGRFGWKAEQPSVAQQVATAFNSDLGLTTTLFPVENHTAAQDACHDAPSGGSPEVSEQILEAVTFYSRILAVPAARGVDSPVVLRGKQLFSEIQCTSCHRPELKTGASPDLPSLAHQVIRPYTDLLLHDMGEELADRRPVFDATGNEWRTPPLWGLGLVPRVNGHATLLHDGRARGFAEAILWHGGEGMAARERFRSLARPDRDALIAFLESI